MKKLAFKDKKGSEESKYDQLVGTRLQEIEQWAREGATNKEIAKRLGIGISTMYRYIPQHPDLETVIAEGRRALKAVKETAVGGVKAERRVEKALFRRAVGYNYKEVKTESNGAAIKRIVTVKHVPPDVGAAKYWLANRTEGSNGKRQENRLLDALNQKAAEVWEDVPLPDALSEKTADAPPEGGAGEACDE